MNEQEREAIKTLQDVVKSCSYLMPRGWLDRHLEDAKEAVETLAVKYKGEEIKEAIDWFQGEILLCKIRLQDGTAGKETARQKRFYELAVEALTHETAL